MPEPLAIAASGGAPPPNCAKSGVSRMRFWMSRWHIRCCRGRTMEKAQAFRIGVLGVLLATFGSTAQAANLTLAWNANSDTNTAGYRLYWGTQTGVYTQSVNVGNTTSFTVSGLTDGMPYYFVVRAYNAAGVESGPSTEVSRRVGVPFSM